MRWIKLLSVRWPVREGRARLCVRCRKCCSFVNQWTVVAGGDAVRDYGRWWWVQTSSHRRRGTSLRTLGGLLAQNNYGHFGEWTLQDAGGRVQQQSPNRRWRHALTLQLSCTVFELFQIWRWIISWPWNLGYRSLKIIVTGAIQLGAVSYSPSIVTMALSCIVCEI